jgi:hypothetical protein
MSNVAQAVLDQQAKRAAQSTFEKTDLTKYFTIALDKGITRGEKIFRMLPPKNPDQSPFIEVYFHVVEVGGKQRKLYDPGKNEGKPSPLNEIYNELKGDPDPAVKKQAAKYRPRLYYIIKGIERGKEQEGVKFWRFPHESKGTGVFDMLTTIFKKFGDVTDPVTGTDLLINLTKVKDQRGKEYTAITSILPNGVSPLSASQELVEQWLADPMTWENVYKKYDHEYLLIIAEGGIPMWSEHDNKWVPKPETDDTPSTSTQETITDALPTAGTPQGTASATHAIVSVEIPVVTAVAEGTTISEDDLPF